MLNAISRLLPAMPGLLTLLPNLLRRRKRDALLSAAVSWPAIRAKLLKSAVVPKDPLVEDGTAFQESQVESAFYFTLSGSYFGGHLRTPPVSDSEGHRLLRQLPEDTEVNVRYNPANPDQTATLPADNPGFPAPIWPG